MTRRIVGPARHVPRPLPAWPRWLLSALGVVSALPAISADAPTPGSVAQSLRQPTLPARRPAEVIFRRDGSESEHDPNGPRFRINAIDFNGNTVFDSYRLKRVVERFVDRELNLWDLGRAADAVSEFYQQRGYPLARALVPAQKVVDGRVRMNIVEGILGKVRVAGNHRYSADTLLHRGGELAPGKPINLPALERKLLVLNEQPGLQARATLQAGSDFGASDLLIQATEKPLSLDVALTNAAREDIGQTRVDSTLSWNNPLGIGDQLSVRGILSQHRLLHYGKASYSVPLGSEGDRLTASYSRVRYRVAGELDILQLGGTAETDELTWTHSLIRSRQHDRSVGLTASYRKFTQQALGVQLSETRLPIYTANWNERWFDDDGTAWNGKLALSSNGRSNADSTRQDAEQLRIEANVDATASLGNQLDLYVKFNSVYSRQRLPDSDKFDVGGPDSVRAYRPSELRGDSGELTTLELRRPFTVAGKVAVATAFVDYAHVVYKQASLRNGNDAIGGAGLGLTAYPTSTTTAKVEFATPLTSHHADDGKHGRLWFNLSASF
jgi:hemolysin activation/secretion protein